MGNLTPLEKKQFSSTTIYIIMINSDHQHEYKHMTKHFHKKKKGALLPTHCTTLLLELFETL